MLREFLSTRILRRVMVTLPIDPQEAPLRGALTATQMVGLVMILGGGLEAFAGMMSDDPEDGEQDSRNGCTVVIVGALLVVVAIVAMVR